MAVVRRRLTILAGVMGLGLMTFAGVSAQAGGGGPMCQGRSATIWGNDGDNTLTGTAGPDVMQGQGGADLILGGDGNDIMCGGDGADSMIGAAGKDKMQGAGSIDSMQGAAGGDVVDGGPSDDYLADGTGQDEIYGQEGVDHGQPCDDAFTDFHNSPVGSGGDADYWFSISNSPPRDNFCQGTPQT